MNKYLSYEKSKRLAELGCVTEFRAGWWDVKTKEFHRMIGDFFLRAYYSAPDCHDLLMELAKYGTSKACYVQFIFHATIGHCHLRIEPDIDYQLHSIEKIRDIMISEVSPVEALGAALIKILEVSNAKQEV